MPAPSRQLPKAKLTLLLAEADVIVRFVIAEHLRSCGLIVVEAANADEAKTILLARPKIDYLLADAQLAGPVSGFALAQWVRRHRPGLVVVLSGGLRGKADMASDMCERAAKKRSPHDGATLHDRMQAMMAERDRRSRKPSSTGIFAAPRRRTGERRGG